MGKYVKVAEAHDIPKNKMQVFKVEDHEILVVNVEGELYGLENRCPHMGYPLYFGSLEGTVLTCGFHYEKFDVTTGKSLGSVTDKPLKRFNIKIHNSIVQVEL
jgi:nitrite reductase/ring-hydroxylating ferredoxin subunit